MSAVARCTRKENALYAARLEHLSASFKPGTDAIRFYLLTDRRSRTGALGFFGRFGILVTESGFSAPDLAYLLSLLTQLGDSVIAAEGDSLHGLWRWLLPRWDFAKGDSFIFAGHAGENASPAESQSFFVCPPAKRDIEAFFELFASGFPAFARRSFDSFYAEESHMIRHDTAKLCGFRRQDQLICGCGVELGSSHLRYLFDLTTVASYRKQGLAADLVIRIAAEDPRPLCLSTREAALSRYYRKLGFIPMGKWIQMTR